jgi:hypothetical protein
MAQWPATGTRRMIFSFYVVALRAFIIVVINISIGRTRGMPGGDFGHDSLLELKVD